MLRMVIPKIQLRATPDIFFRSSFLSLAQPIIPAFPVLRGVLPAQYSEVLPGFPKAVLINPLAR